MGASPPAMVADLVERFDRDRKVFLSGDSKEVQLLKAQPPYEQESLTRTISATDKQTDALVYELYGLKEEEIRIVGGGRV